MLFTLNSKQDILDAFIKVFKKISELVQIGKTKRLLNQKLLTLIKLIICEYYYGFSNFSLDFTFQILLLIY